MEAQARRPFTSLQRQKALFLAQISSWDENTLTFRASDAAWNGLEILDHLVRTETAILAAMVANSASRRAVPLPDRLRGLLLTALFRTPARVRAPAAAQAILPGNSQDLAALTRLWDQNHTDLEEFLTALSGQPVRSAVFQHPVSGWMNLPRTLNFLAAHVCHHQFQLKRLEAACSRR